jgi:hypothetical protein
MSVTIRATEGFGLYNNLAVGVTWAAERLAVPYLDATALGTALVEASVSSDTCP